MGAVLALALVALPTRVAQSATTLYACVNNSSGAVHFVSASTTCAHNETLVSWNIVGPPGPAGPPGPPGPPSPAGLGFNPLQVAILRWYDANQTGFDFPIGPRPYGVAFDVANIWVTSLDSFTVTKLRASDGACVGTCTFSVGPGPFEVAFDGANIWVANFFGNTVSKR